MEIETTLQVEKKLPVNVDRLIEFTKELEKYHSGRKKTADRILASENWWKLRNLTEENKYTTIGEGGAFTSQSGWLHNVITSKHADAMDAFPQGVFLPREPADQKEAKALGSIVPCILEQNKFEDVYSAAMWRKCKTGTGAYKVVWDRDKLGGLGDIGITSVNLLNLYWQPEITDIQKSRYFFHTELLPRSQVEEDYPATKGKLKGQAFIASKFLNDEHDSGDNITVIEVYYHKKVNGKNTLQYCKYCGDQVLFASENDLEPKYDELGQLISKPMAETGLYDHGRYPYVFDPLFPVEGSPCGYGYVDICKNPQIAIDILKTCFIRNARVGSTPRYFSRLDGNINEGEFLDLSKPIVHVAGNMDDATLKPIMYNPLPGNFLNLMQDTVQELRETSGNTETSTGVSSGVTAAAAIAALQQASGKGSRDSNRGSYRAFSEILNLCVELIRQFYDLPRKFRITGDDGGYQFITYTNENLRAQDQGQVGGHDMGYRLPVFDIRITAQKKNDYSAMAQNELCLQLFQMGFFNPALADQAMSCLKLMDFDGKDTMIQEVADKSQLLKKLGMYMKLSLDLSDSEDLSADITQDMQATLGMAMPSGGGEVNLDTGNNELGERTHVAKARQRAAEVAQP